MRIKSFLAALSLAVVSTVIAAPQPHTDNGVIVVTRPAVEAKFDNKGWTPEMEAGFWQRSNVLINAFKGNNDPRTGGEGEKWSYPSQMLNYLSGNRDSALKILAAEDGDAGTDHAHTLGIDWYWSFTIKGQARKYFQFGDVLPADYLARMKQSAKLWTAEDPRPNFELILLLDNKNEQVRKYALDAITRSKAELEKNWAGKPGDELRAWAKTAPPDRAKAVEIIDKLVKKYQGQDLGADVAKWQQWWKEYADNDWVVMEEAERIMNIHPHPRYEHGKPGAIGADFSPAARSYWVDARNTDNLRAMRETSVYLMAEEAGNELTRLIYKERIKRFVRACYTIGMGEWDSENYLSHTTMPYHNLYDFAKDPEVKLMAKAQLDWIYAANAMKYYRGGFGGPTKRDYGGASRVFGSAPAQAMWLFDGDTPAVPPRPEEDTVHAILSTYRPPAVVIAIAKKDFKKPVEMLDSKPTYSNWFPGADAAPEFFETMFYSDSYYLGSCVSASASHDVGPFKLLAWNTKRGVDYFLANSGKKMNSKNELDEIAQYRNLCIFLNGGGQGFGMQIADTATQSSEDGVWFIEMEKTYLAIRPINLGPPAKQAGGRGPAGDSAYFAAAAGKGLTGFALEAGEQSAYKSMAGFKAAIKAKSKLEQDGEHFTLTGADGRKLESTFNRKNELPLVMRDGKSRDWTKEFDMYKPADGQGPITQGWKTGSMKLNAGGQTFTESIDENGKVTFSE